MQDYKLFLDDIRFPKEEGWTIARTYDEAVNLIKTQGMPKVISFDHDLGMICLQTGYDLAKFIVDYDIENNVIDDTFIFYVHSANPVGAKNIRMLLENYINFKSSQNDTNT